MNYIAGWNDPGYLPDMEPATFPTLEEARQFLVDEAKEREANADNEDQAQDWCNFAEELNLCFVSEEGFEYGPDGQAFWIHKEN